MADVAGRASVSGQGVSLRRRVGDSERECRPPGLYRHYIEAKLVLLECLAKGARFRFPVEWEFFDPCESAAVLDSSGLGARQYMVYGRMISSVELADNVVSS